jgi:excinuclease ABC subunit B
VIEEAAAPGLVLAPTRSSPPALRRVQELLPDNAVEYFVSYYDYYQPEAYVPRSDTYIEKESSVNEAIDRMRHSATRSLLERDDVIIVASVSCLYGIGSVETYSAMIFDLKKGQSVDQREIIRKLVALQYKRNDQAFAAAISGCAATIWKSFRRIMRTAPGGCPSLATRSRRSSSSIR